MHTFELSSELLEKDYHYLHANLPKLNKVSSHVERTNFYAKKGVTQMELITHSYQDKQEETSIVFFRYYLILRCNLSVIMGGNPILLLDLQKFTPQQLLAGIQRRIHEIKELQAIQIDQYPVCIYFKTKRVDLAEDILTDFPKEVLWCCNMRFPYPHYQMKRKQIAKDPSVLYLESCCFYNNTRSVNLYSKQAAMKNTNKAIPEKEQALISKIVRIELQIKKKGICNLHLPTKRSLYPFLTYDFVHSYLLKKSKAMFGVESFVSKKRAIAMIQHSQYSHSQQEILLSILCAIPIYQGVYELAQAIDKKSPALPQAYSWDLDSFRSHLNKFKKLGIQPVALPDEWGIDELPSIYELLQKNQYYKMNRKEEGI